MAIVLVALLALPWVVAASEHEALDVGCEGYECRGEVISVGPNGLEVRDVESTSVPFVLTFYDVSDGTLATAGYYDVRVLDEPVWTDDLTSLRGRTLMVRGFYLNPKYDGKAPAWSARFVGAVEQDSNLADSWGHGSQPLFRDSHSCSSEYCTSGIPSHGLEGEAGFVEVASLLEDDMVGLGASCAYLARDAPCPRAPTATTDTAATTATSGRLPVSESTDSYCVSVASMGSSYVAAVVVAPRLRPAGEWPPVVPIASCIGF